VISRLILLVLSVAAVAAQPVQLGEAPQPQTHKSSTVARVAGDATDAVSATVAADLPSVDVSSRSSVRQFYQSQFLPDVAMSWTGNMTTGEPGTTSDAFKQRVIQRVNFYRALAGLRSNVTHDAEFSRIAQAAALMMSANSALSHTPPTDWKFYTADGSAAAGKSNLALGLSGCIAIDAYMEDFGSNNGPVGHRRWILHPKLTRTGTGDVPTITSPRTWEANALVVLDGVNNGIARSARDGFVAWPYPGYIPHTLVPQRFSVSHPAANFSNSIVTATHDGATLNVVVEHRNGNYGEGPAIVFTLDKAGRSMSKGGFVTADLEKPIRIRITNTLINNQLQEISYDVIPFNVSVAGPAAPTLQLPGTLSATVGTAFSYQVVATGATSYTASGLPAGLTMNTATGLISGTPTTSGTFTVSVTASNGTAATGSFTLVVAGTASSGSSRLINISTRSRVGTGENIMIAGFVIEGTEPKSILIRAVGPGLVQLGVPDAAKEVILRLNNGTQDIASNQGWSTSPDAATIAATSATVGAFPLTQGSGDSVILRSLPAGPYTALVSCPAGKEGVALVEVYEVSKTGSRLINISTRAQAASAGDTMIAGVVIEGSAARRLLIRAVGKSLTTFGITNPIPRPQIQLMSGNTVVRSVGAWSTAANASEISAAFAEAGAFALPASNEDSAMVVTLQPGVYTALVTPSAGTSSGLCLIEAYDLD
jgi:uncharacterized protein YkwD